jgi:hypothetical protein
MTRLPDVRVISSPTQNYKNWGLDVGLGQKRPCQHLGPDFRQLSTLKKQHVSLRIFLEKKMFYTKKVTRLPVLTVYIVRVVLYIV